MIGEIIAAGEVMRRIVKEYDEMVERLGSDMVT